jgi:hypothetical protein
MPRTAHSSADEAPACTSSALVVPSTESTSSSPTALIQKTASDPCTCAAHARAAITRLMTATPTTSALAGSATQTAAQPV